METTHEDPHGAATQPAGPGDPPVAAPVVDDADRPLHPNYIRVRQLGGWITAGVVSLACAALVTIVALGGETPAWGVIVLIVAWLAVTVLLGWRAHAWPTIDYQHRRWRLAGLGMEIRRGVWWREIINVPRARIQHTDVNQGPIERRFGLAHLVIHTAGTLSASVYLFGLSYDDALRVRDELLRTGTGDAV